jgi:L-alanine-DL-glutamate epimerase-like enolase superfamily enzyme
MGLSSKERRDMGAAPKITRIVVVHYAHEIENLTLEDKYGFDMVYLEGARLGGGGSILMIETDAGVRSEVPGGIDARTANYLLGRNPLEREIIWQDLKRLFRGSTSTPPGDHDVALWDIAGKMAGVPISALLGGWRTRLPCYASTYHGDENGGLSTPEDYGAFALHCKEEYGYPAFKIHGWIGAPIAQEVAAVLAIRDAVGDQIEIGIECHFRWNRASMERIARALEPYNILFLEDVMPAVYPDEIKALAQRTTIPVVGSELLMTRWQLREWLEKHVSQIVMTDPIWNGGIAETRKIATLAETFGVPLVLHNVAGPICHAACMHLGAHIPNLFYVESVRAFCREVFPVLSDLSPVVADGHLDIPSGPGLGVELLDAALQRDDLIREESEGEGLAGGRRAMGDHWAVEEIR